jgi:hypothetical protein
MQSLGRRLGVRAVRRGRTALGLLAAVALLLPLSGTAQAADPNRHTGVEALVVVRATSGHVAQARADVAHLGGSIGAALPKINGFRARISLHMMSRLQHAPGIAGVTQVGVIQ